MSENSRSNLTTFAAVSLLLGNTVGVGIFLTPAEVAAACPEPMEYFGMWVLGALVAVAGALALAELSVMMPRSGGDYVYLDRAFGPAVARAWGTMAVFGTFCGSIAALAVGTVETIASTSASNVLRLQVATIAGMELTWGDLTAVGIVLAVTLANTRPVSQVGRVQLVVTMVPVALYLIGGLWALLVMEPTPAASVVQSSTTSPSVGLAAAFGAVFFTYSGWNVLTYVGGEINEPARTIPRAVIIGLVGTFVLYLLLNVLFIKWIPLHELAHTPNAGVAVAERLMGPNGGIVVAVALSAAIIAGLNATVMAGSRIVEAMAQAGHLPQGLGATRPGGAPVAALMAQAGWSCALVLTGSFGWLVAVTGSTMFLLSCLTVTALFVLRRRGLPSAYRTPGYPVLPALYILCGVLVLVSESLTSISPLVTGITVFVMFVLFSVVATRWRRTADRGRQ